MYEYKVFILLLLIASAPELYEVNFNGKLTVIVDNPVNLTVNIDSDLPLTSDPMWSRDDADLSNDSYVMNYTKKKKRNNYTSLIIEKASYYNDEGNYYLTASNQCGTSTVSVDLDIVKGNN